MLTPKSGLHGVIEEKEIMIGSYKASHITCVQDSVQREFLVFDVVAGECGDHFACACACAF